MKGNWKIIRRFRSKLKNEILKNYLKNGRVDIDKIIDDFYSYVYILDNNLHLKCNLQRN